MKYILCSIFILIFSFSLSAQIKKSNKSDEFVLYNCEMAIARLYDYALSLHNDPNITAHIIFYEGDIPGYPPENVTLPRRGQAKARINDLRRYLIKDKNIEPDRLVIVNGGIRKLNSVELWLVPKTGLIPIPTPSLKKIKYAKGRPSGFCNELF